MRTIDDSIIYVTYTACKVSNYGLFSGPYFPAFGLNTERYSYPSIFSPNAGKYGQEKTPYLDTFHAVISKGKFQVITHSDYT